MELDDREVGMPPFKYDPAELWEAIRKLADDTDQSWRFTKKGDRRPREDIERQQAAKRRNQKARQEIASRALAAKRTARNRAKLRPPVGQTIADRMLLAMQPGAWYGMGDIVRRIGEKREARSKVILLAKQKALEVVSNPAWCGVAMSPQQIEAGGEPHPQRLYRLSERGLELRSRLEQAKKVP